MAGSFPGCVSKILNTRWGKSGFRALPDAKNSLGQKSYLNMSTYLLVLLNHVKLKTIRVAIISKICVWIHCAIFAQLWFKSLVRK